jgi:hypothetical protein
MGSNLDDLLAWFWLDLKGKSRHFYDAALFWRNRILTQESVTHTRAVPDATSSSFWCFGGIASRAKIFPRTRLMRSLQNLKELFVQKTILCAFLNWNQNCQRRLPPLFESFLSRYSFYAFRRVGDFIFRLGTYGGPGKVESGRQRPEGGYEGILGFPSLTKIHWRSNPVREHNRADNLPPVPAHCAIGARPTNLLNPGT